MKVLLINGSPRKGGETFHALATVEQVLHRENIETEWFWLGTDPIRGCVHCDCCETKSRCVFTDDACNEVIEKIIAADAVIIGSPVYFAGPNGALCALLDRVFYAASNFGYLFAGKPAAAVTTCWRAGATAALDRLNKYFTFSEMPVVSSNYWNLKLEGEDPYGDGIMVRLGENFAKMLRGRKSV
ncbi:flavodoxin family protein [bacterium 210820-DFI.6.37]|nr:flavodoxin family protein [bacterium 210820-DFI.6.37]